ncbi:hypothetical protein PUN28_018608 [Cardiocondyla obscurior]|uniref:Secreted protein n=1 Tax=Cardiocondyla obscurior TaxID=286306 RepID=A0AAW2EIJ6_9HYME
MHMLICVLTPCTLRDVVAAACRDAIANADHITLLTRLYDLATMSNHGYNICDKRTNLHLPISKHSRRDPPAVSCVVPFSFGCSVARSETCKERRLSSR